MQIKFSYRMMILAGFTAIAGQMGRSAAIYARASGPEQASTRVVNVAATLTNRPDRRAIPRSFLGFSIEYGSIPQFFSRPATLRAITRLTGHLTKDNGPPLFRIGGNSEDSTVWRHLTPESRRRGNRIAINPDTARYLHDLVKATGSRLILGLNLGRGSALMAVPWIKAAQRIIGAPHIMAFEIGNEPDLYNRHGVRPRSYTLRDYFRQVQAFSRQVLPVLSRPKMLAGPAFTGPWRRFTPQYIAQFGTHLAVVTMHEYPLGAPVRNPRSPKFGSIANLLKPSSVAAFASLIRTTVQAGHKRHIPVRFAEINSAYMGGKRGVSNTFAQSLWSLDLLFTLAAIHCDGVNFHTGPVYGAFWPHRGGVHVLPLYYGMWVFAHAARHRAHLVRVRYRTPMNLKIWATQSTGGRLHIVLINKSLHRSAAVVLALPPTIGTAATAGILRLSAASAGAMERITFGGRTFAGTLDGRPSGAPQAIPVHILHGQIRVLMPPANAALINIH